MMDKRLEEIFDSANAEFFLQLNDGLSESFGVMIKEFLENVEGEKEIDLIVEDYKQWKEEHGAN